TPHTYTLSLHDALPISPSNDERIITFDMATTVQAWGKVLDARAKHQSIPDTWAVDANGEPTTNARDVHAVVPVAGPKGYGLMMRSEEHTSELQSRFDLV